MAKYLEDYKVGDKHVSPGRTVSEADIDIAMGIGRYVDPFMIDAEYAKTTVFGKRVAPGRFIPFMMGGLSTMTGWMDLETVIALLGLDKIRVTSPLFAGDTIRIEIEVLEIRKTSKPDKGILIHQETCKNQRNQVVAEVEVTHLVKYRPAA